MTMLAHARDIKKYCRYHETTATILRSVGSSRRKYKPLLDEGGCSAMLTPNQTEKSLEVSHHVVKTS